MKMIPAKEIIGRSIQIVKKCLIMETSGGKESDVKTVPKPSWKALQTINSSNKFFKL